MYQSLSQSLFELELELLFELELDELFELELELELDELFELELELELDELFELELELELRDELDDLFELELLTNCRRSVATAGAICVCGATGAARRASGAVAMSVRPAAIAAIGMVLRFMVVFLSVVVPVCPGTSTTLSGRFYSRERRSECGRCNRIARPPMRAAVHAALPFRPRLATVPPVARKGLAQDALARFGLLFGFRSNLARR